MAAPPLMVAAPPIRLALAAPTFRIEAPALDVPPGTRPGALSRTIRPFGRWTLICDTDGDARRRVCMTTQTIVDAQGRMVFSWSLAGSESGAPVLVLRAPASVPAAVTPAAAGLAPRVTLAIGVGNALHRAVALSACDGSICVGYLPVDAALARAMNGGALVTVRTEAMPAFATSFTDLAAAVASLR